MRTRELKRMLQALFENPRVAPQRQVQRDQLEEALLVRYRKLHRTQWRLQMFLNPKTQLGRLSLGVLALALVVIGACQTPTSSEVEMGQQLQISWDQRPESVPSVQELMGFLEGVNGVDDVSVSISETDNGPMSMDIWVWGQRVSLTELEDSLMERLGEAEGVRISATILEGTVRESLGQRIGREFFNIKVSGDTEEEIRREIMKQLADQGVKGATVDVKVDGGLKTITIDRGSNEQVDGKEAITQERTVIELKESND